MTATLPQAVEERTLTAGQAFLYVLHNPQADARTVLCAGCGDDCGISNHQGWAGDISAAVGRHRISCSAGPNPLYTLKEQR